MIKIIIKESDLLFRQGMAYLISDFFWLKFRRKVEFISEYTAENIADADVIVLSMCNGERYTCFPELRFRSKGIIIGLIDERNQRNSPLCFDDIIYITRSESLDNIINYLYIAWYKWLERGFFSPYVSCCGCKHYTMSLKQWDILKRIHNGDSMVKIARSMNISYKTLMAHKYIVKKKLSLKNDYELFILFERLNEKRNEFESVCFSKQFTTVPENKKF